MLNSRLLRSTSFRLSAIYAVLLIVSFLSAAGGAWLATRTAAMDQAEERLERAQATILARAESTDGAVPPAVERLSRHGSILWRLTDADGATLAGDPTIPNDTLGIRMHDLPDAADSGFRGDHAVLTRGLPGGGRLTTALDIEASEVSRDAVLSALLATGAVSVLLALAAGVWATRHALKRMDSLAGAARTFGEGNLSVRAPERAGSAPDDVDQLIRDFNRMFEQVDRLVANIRRVSADVAHELRTPLTRVRQRLEDAAGATAVGQGAEAIDAAQAGIDELLRTFDSMLRLSEIEGGGLKAGFSDIDLGDVTDTVCDAYRPAIEASGRSLEVRTVPDAVIRGDRQLLSQAVANLLENAICHTPEGTLLVAEVAVANADAEVALSVRDDGPGVPEHQRDWILEPFNRVDTSRRGHGAGLGLTIVAAIAKLHRAAMRLEDASPGLRAVMVFPKGA